MTTTRMPTRTFSFRQLNFHPSTMLWPNDSRCAPARPAPADERSPLMRAVHSVERKNIPAWTANAAPVLNRDINAPATAGPVLRAMLKTTALSPMALVRDLGGTVSEIIAARDG